MENWKNLKYEGYEHYQVSDLGNVRGPKGFMKQRVNTRGYMMLGLRKKGKEGTKQKFWNVHRLVAEHFLPSVDGKLYVNHKDLNKTNNQLNNLEWVTPKENVRHAIENGRYPFWKEGREKPNGRSYKEYKGYTPQQTLDILKENAIKKRKKIRIINEILGIDLTFESISQASQDERIKCNEKTIRNSLKKRNKSRLGYICYYI